MEPVVSPAPKRDRRFLRFLCAARSPLYRATRHRPPGLPHPRPALPSGQRDNRQRIGQQWEIFNPKTVLAGIAAERKKRNGDRYVKRVQQPHAPSMAIPEREELLGVPREYFEFKLWFLREQGWAPVRQRPSDHHRQSVLHAEEPRLIVVVRTHKIALERHRQHLVAQSKRTTFKTQNVDRMR